MENWVIDNFGGSKPEGIIIKTYTCNEREYLCKKEMYNYHELFLKYALKLRSDKCWTNQMSQFVIKRRDFKSNGRNFLNRCNQERGLTDILEKRIGRVHNASERYHGSDNFGSNIQKNMNVLTWLNQIHFNTTDRLIVEMCINLWNQENTVLTYTCVCMNKPYTH